MDDYTKARENLEKIVTEINGSKSHTSNVSNEITSAKEEIKEMVEQNDNNQAKILSILIKKINKLEDILK